jgi:aspartate dehydrogenase
MTPRPPLRIGFIGDGGVARSVREALAELPARHDGDPRFAVVAVLSRRAVADADRLAVEDIDSLLQVQPDVVVECAGHEAVARHGEVVLRAGASLLIVSIGALADSDLHRRLVTAAEAGGGRLILAPGAMAGIEALAGARLGGLDRVRYVGRKPPAAWRGTPAEALLDLAALREPQVFYRGMAREAAQRYPMNSNVAATVALAGLGFERTEVELIADPTIAKNLHELMFEGADGRFEITVCGEPSKANPKTSALTAHSIARLLDAMTSPLVI